MALFFMRISSGLPHFNLGATRASEAVVYSTATRVATIHKIPKGVNPTFFQALIFVNIKPGDLRTVSKYTGKDILSGTYNNPVLHAELAQRNTSVANIESLLGKNLTNRGNKHGNEGSFDQLGDQSSEQRSCRRWKGPMGGGNCPSPFRLNKGDT